MTASRSPESLDASSTLKGAKTPVHQDAEWLLVDGRGGYACGTAGDLPTRRYHGLWVTRPEGIAGRRMIVAGLDERVGAPPRVGGADEAQFAHLMSAHWSDLPSPSRGQAHTSFSHRPLPTWTFETEFGVVERTIALREQSDSDRGALLVRWRNCSEQPVRLEVRPLLGWCNVDHLPKASDDFDGTVHSRGASWGFRPTDELPPLWLTVDGVAAFRADPTWYRGFLYESDRVRGYDHVGDRWTPGVLEIDLPPGADVTASFALHDPLTDGLATMKDLDQAAQHRWHAATQSEHPLAARLALGADDFFYRAVGDRVGVLAGFPWFGEWGRDVFIALPGLTLARGRVELCEQVLTGCLPFLRDGLLPNIYGKDIAGSNYGSCDAALWFSLASMRFADAGHNPELVREKLLPALRGIADAYTKGTELGLEVSEDGLLHAGRKDLNATWMDARTSDGPVTPREGMPVEIQALWYALLAFLAEHEGTAKGGGFAAMRDRCGAAFLSKFWMDEHKSLADRVHAGDADGSIRPNMLVAAALARSPLSVSQRRSVVDVAKEHLVTSSGLRTLGPADEAYIGVYGGGLEGRDKAYHQGTVWPWPAGFCVEAALRGVPEKLRKQEASAWMQWLDDLLAGELVRAGLDHVSEVFDGDQPHRPGGTFAQAWNTGELLRAHTLCQAVVSGEVTDSSWKAGVL